MPSYSSASPSLRNFLNSGCLFNVQAGQLTISPRTGEIGSPAASAITTVGIRRARWVIITSAINKTRDAQYLDDATVEITTEFSLCNNLFISIFDCLWSVSALEHSDSVQHYRDRFQWCRLQCLLSTGLWLPFLCSLAWRRRKAMCFCCGLSSTGFCSHHRRQLCFARPDGKRRMR